MKLTSEHLASYMENGFVLLLKLFSAKEVEAMRAELACFATPSPGLSTACIILGEASEMSGCLYFISGSHRICKIEPDFDAETTSYGPWKIPHEKINEQVDKLSDPGPLTGQPGTAILVHPQILHVAGHNMEPRPRWQIYFVYDTLANRPATIHNPRSEYVCSGRCDELQMLSNDAIVKTREAVE